MIESPNFERTSEIQHQLNPVHIYCRMKEMRPDLDPLQIRNDAGAIEKILKIYIYPNK